MKIIRDGVEYELTRAEMREVYEKMKAEYLREDVECKAEEMEIELSDTTMDYVVGRVEKCLSNNDSYMESYWMTIEYVLNEQVED
jgi:hypothetical protein